MQKKLKTLGFLACLALPLTVTVPAMAKDAASPNQSSATSSDAAMQRPGRPGKCRCPQTQDGQPMGPMHGGMGMGGPQEGLPIEIMFPQGPETPEMTALRQEMQKQHQKIQAEHARMRELMQKMKELRQKMRTARTSRGKGNAAPANPLPE